MNINLDNYEAYLLDYMEGTLSPDETRQLQAFVAAQGMDWGELTEALPYLEAPNVVYEKKESLKKKGKVIPMLVKVGAAAAAAGLLFTLVWKPVDQRPQQELMAELKPIEVSHIDAQETVVLLPRRATENMPSQPRAMYSEASVTSRTTNKVQPSSERNETPLLAEIQPIEAPASLSNQVLLTRTMGTGPDFAPYLFSDDYALASFTDDDYDEPSLLGKGLLKMTDGKYESLGSMIQGGLQLAKEEINLAAADFAITAYYRVDDQIVEAKERWEKRREP